MSQVILFDLDGTLTESGEGITKSVQYALEKMGIQGDDPEILRRFIGPPLKDSFMTYYGMNEEAAEQAIAYYRERFTKTGIFENQLYPKVKDLLEVLKVNDKILGIASSKPEVFVKRILEYFQIDGYFQVVVGSELDGARSTKAEVIEEALNRLGKQSDRATALMVGDKRYDVEGANACGVPCVGVTYGYGTREELEEAGAVYIAESVEDLGILASPNDEETTEHVESVRRIRRTGRERRRAKEKKAENQESADDKGPKNPEPAPEAEALPARRPRPILDTWRIIYPILLHYGISILVSIGFGVYFMWRVISGAVSGTYADVARWEQESALYQTIPASVIVGLIAFFLYRGDQRKRKDGSLGKGADFVWCPPVIWFSVIVLAIAGSQMLNDLFQIIQLNEKFPSYTELSQNVMVGRPEWLLILSVGILAPITEELIFRGLVFRRMKDWFAPTVSVLLSSLIFGIYHGNMVQFIYATLLGMVLAVVYHRTGTLLTSILAHMATNLWSIFGNGWWRLLMDQLPFGIWIGIGIELLLCVIPGYWIFAYKKGEKRKTTSQ